MRDPVPLALIPLALTNILSPLPHLFQNLLRVTGPQALLVQSDLKLAKKLKANNAESAKAKAMKRKMRKKFKARAMTMSVMIIIGKCSRYTVYPILPNTFLKLKIILR